MNATRFLSYAEARPKEKRDMHTNGTMEGGPAGGGVGGRGERVKWGEDDASTLCACMKRS
jgi:hypothetical protein